MIYIIASIAAIAGFLFGFDEGVIAGILPTLTQHFHITEAAEGFLASALPLGALFVTILLGSVIATKLTTKVGRRTAVLFAAILFTVSALAAALATSLWMLTGARLIVGVAIGIASVMTPLYIAEMVPAKVRGRLVAAYQLAITLGIFMGYVINYLFVYGINWRMMFAAGAVPSLVLLVGMWFLPESPRWLLLAGKKDQAKNVLRRIHPQQNVEQEYNEIEHTIEDEGNMVRWRELFSPTVRPALIVAMMMFVLQQLSGINVVIYYAPAIFQNVGYTSTQTQILATVGVGTVNVLSTVLSMWLIDKIGRRKLLYIGFAGTALTLGIIGLSSVLHVAHLDTIALISTFVYIAAFAISLGPIPFIIMSEVFPIHVRNTGMGLASMCNWGFNFIVVFIFPIMILHWGLAITFWIYALACIFGLFYTYYYIPETKGISLEDITEHLLQGKALRDLGK